MSSPSPPKPWETRNAAGTSSAISSIPNNLSATSAAAPTNPSTSTTRPNGLSTTTPSSTSTPSSSSSSSSQPPALPSKPRTLKPSTNRPTATTNYTTPAYPGTINRYGTSTYGTLGSYTAPYNRFGGNMYGGYGGLYGGLGGYGGIGGYGGYQPPPNVNDPNSLTNTFNQSTQATFQIIESIVQAFGGFAQMLESTYMATHSSFFAMVQVAEQFGNLRNTLGSILGIFALLRWIRSLLAKFTGKPLPPSSSSTSRDLTPSNFFLFQQQGRSNPHPPRPNPSKKPLLVFLLAVFGLPLIMGKIIRALSRHTNSNTNNDPSQQQLLQLQQQTQTLLDPTKLSFCRVMHDYTPAVADSEELSVKKGDLVAVLSKNDPLGQPSDWWRCRTRDARFGWLPSTYLQVVVRGDDGGMGKEKERGKEGDAGGGGDGDGGGTRGTGGNVGNIVKQRDITTEGFRRSGFYS